MCTWPWKRWHHIYGHRHSITERTAGHIISWAFVYTTQTLHLTCCVAPRNGSFLTVWTDMLEESSCFHVITRPSCLHGFGGHLLVVGHVLVLSNSVLLACGVLARFRSQLKRVLWTNNTSVEWWSSLACQLSSEIPYAHTRMPSVTDPGWGMQHRCTWVDISSCCFGNPALNVMVTAW